MCLESQLLDAFDDVVDFLVEVGVQRDRITSSGRGEREPLVPAPDEVDEPRNRRVEVDVR